MLVDIGKPVGEGGAPSAFAFTECSTLTRHDIFCCFITKCVLGRLEVLVVNSRCFRSVASTDWRHFRWPLRGDCTMVITTHLL